MWWPAVVKSEWALKLDYGRSPHACVNQRLQIQLELLIMRDMPLETCWAFNERWNNKFYCKVASCWLFLLNPATMHGSMNIKSKKNQQMQPCNRIYYYKVLLKARHVSSGTPIIIRSSKLYLQPLVYIAMWWPAVAKAEWDFPTQPCNGRSPHGYINQTLQTQFRAPDDERCAARNMLSLQ